MYIQAIFIMYREHPHGSMGRLCFSFVIFNQNKQIADGFRYAKRIVTKFGTTDGMAVHSGGNKSFSNNSPA